MRLCKAQHGMSDGYYNKEVELKILLIRNKLASRDTRNKNFGGGTRKRIKDWMHRTVQLRASMTIRTAQRRNVMIRRQHGNIVRFWD